MEHTYTRLFPWYPFCTSSFPSKRYYCIWHRCFRNLCSVWYIHTYIHTYIQENHKITLYAPSIRLSFNVRWIFMVLRGRTLRWKRIQSLTIIVEHKCWGQPGLVDAHFGLPISILRTFTKRSIGGIKKIKKNCCQVIGNSWTAWKK